MSVPEILVTDLICSNEVAEKPQALTGSPQNSDHKVR